MLLTGLYMLNTNSILPNTDFEIHFWSVCDMQVTSFMKSLGSSRLVFDEKFLTSCGRWKGRLCHSCLVSDKKVTSFWLMICHCKGKTCRLCHRQLSNADLVTASFWQKLRLCFFFSVVSHFIIIFWWCSKKLLQMSKSIHISNQYPVW